MPKKSKSSKTSKKPKASQALIKLETSRTITTSFANKEIRRYLKFREEGDRENIFKSLKPGAKKYYESNEVSFIFKKKELDDLIAKKDANAYRIYYGATPTGEPTLIVVPCQIEAKATDGKDNGNDYTVENVITDDSEAAEQYPRKQEPNGSSRNFNLKNDDFPPKYPLPSEPS